MNNSVSSHHMFYKFLVNTQRWRWRALKQEAAAAAAAQRICKTSYWWFNKAPLTAAMKYSIRLQPSDWTAGWRLAPPALQFFVCLRVWFVFGRLVLFTGINESQLGEKEEIFCGSGCDESPLAASLALLDVRCSTIVCVAFIPVIRSSPPLHVFFLSFKER